MHGIILGKTYQRHRVIWALENGEWPAFELDHENHDTLDNRLENLIPKTTGQNLKNKSLYKNNKSGVSGVQWHESKSKWVAFIGNKKPIYLGIFDDFESAVAVRKAAELDYGYHKNHGT